MKADAGPFTRTTGGRSDPRSRQRQRHVGCRPAPHCRSCSRRRPGPASSPARAAARSCGSPSSAGIQRRRTRAVLAAGPLLTRWVAQSHVPDVHKARRFHHALVPGSAISPKGANWSYTFQSGLYLRGATIARTRPKQVLAFRFPFYAQQSPAASASGAAPRTARRRRSTSSTGAWRRADSPGLVRPRRRRTRTASSPA